MLGIAKGMSTTLRHLLRPSITYGYPNTKRELPERSRMSFTMLVDEDGLATCKACLVCEKSCPEHAIRIESVKRADGPGRVLTRFTLDLGRCMYCGLCLEQCPTHGLTASGDFETCSANREDLVRVLYAAAVVPEQPDATAAEEGGAS